MVLQTRATNLAKDENAPPTPSSRPKGLVSRLYEDANSRGRTRSSGTTHTSKYRVEQARRRKAKAKASLRMSVATTVPEADVEMTNAASSSSSSLTNSSSITQPLCFLRELSRPHYREVSLELLREVEPALEDLDLPYIRSWLEFSAPQLVRALHNIKVDPMKDTLPKEMTVEAPEMSDYLPTHMLAVYGRASKSTDAAPSPRKITLFPIHSLVLLANCTNVAKPPAATGPAPLVGETQVVLPVWPLCLPVPSVYPQLSTYLYTKQQDFLLRSFMPAPPPSDLMTNPDRTRGFALHIAQTFTVPAMMKCMFNVNGLWQNVCALGVFDDNLWDAMDVMWQTLLTALAIATGKPSLMLPLPAPSSSSSRPATTAEST